MKKSNSTFSNTFYTTIYCSSASKCTNTLSHSYWFRNRRWRRSNTIRSTD